MKLNHHALVVGVGADLENTVIDAEGVAKHLSDESRCAFDPKNVTLLTEKKADRDGILGAMDDLANRAKGDVTTVVYFSGHGYAAESSMGGGYFLMPNGYNVEKLAKTAISGREFAEKLAAIKSERVLLLLDCCHAQGIGESKAKSVGVTLTKSPIPDDVEKLFKEGKGRVVISSSKSGQVSWTGVPYSLFTRAVIEALCGANQAGQNGDGFVRVMDIALYASRMLDKWTRNKQYPQHPSVDIQSADNFVVAYYAGGDKKPKSLDLPPVNEDEAEKQNRAAIQYVQNQSGGVNMGQGNTYDFRGSQGAIVGANDSTINQNFGTQNINTGGGAHVGGKVTVGRDQININIGGNPSPQDMANIAKLMQRDTAPTLSETIRLDVATPKEVVVGKTFRVGVAVKQQSSPPLKVKDLENTASAQGEVLRSAADEIVRYKVEIIAPDCDIAEPKSYTFRLKAGTDSSVIFFTLTPKHAGMLDVLVNAYQEGDIVAASPIVIEAKVEAIDSQQSDNSTLSKIVELLDKYFSLSDIEGLCFDLGIDDENLKGEKKIEKARALVKYCQQTDTLNALKSKMLDERPNLKGKL
jgi:hypothetical protein